MIGGSITVTDAAVSVSRPDNSGWLASYHGRDRMLAEVAFALIFVTDDERDILDVAAESIAAWTKVPA